MDSNSLSIATFSVSSDLPACATDTNPVASKVPARNVEKYFFTIILLSLVFVITASFHLKSNHTFRQLSRRLSRFAGAKKDVRSRFIIIGE